MDVLKWTIRQGFGGSYRQSLRASGPDQKEASPQQSQDGGKPVHVAIVGSGLAGISAAVTLLEKGFHVTIYEAESFIGGKCGAWPKTLSDGSTVHVSHGLHGIFPMYYNCIKLFEKLGVSQYQKPIGEYLILGLNSGEKVGFKDIETTPILSLISMWLHKLYALMPVLKSPTTVLHLLEFLRYCPERTVRDFDNVSYEEFCDQGKIPDDLRLMFNTFARSFFATEDKVSMAHMIKAFHFYFMSNDKGLLYDYIAEDYHQAFCEPAKRYVQGLGGQFLLDTPVHEIEIANSGGTSTGKVNGKEYDHIVLSCDVKGVQSILKQSPSLVQQCPSLARQLAHVKPGQRYTVLKLWMDQRADPNDELPVFIFFVHTRLLDSVVLCHRFEPDSASWAERHGGGVYELHTYAIADDIADNQIQHLLLQDLRDALPGLRDAKVVDTSFMLNRNFTAFHVGKSESRPTTETASPAITLAGDWVKLPTPGVLMEGAATSGLLAANAISRLHGVKEELVETVPPRGIFTWGQSDSDERNGKSKIQDSLLFTWIIENVTLLFITSLVYCTGPFEISDSTPVISIVLRAILTTFVMTRTTTAMVWLLTHVVYRHIPFFAPESAIPKPDRTALEAFVHSEVAPNMAGSMALIGSRLGFRYLGFALSKVLFPDGFVGFTLKILVARVAVDIVFHSVHQFWLHDKKRYAAWHKFHHSHKQVRMITNMQFDASDVLLEGPLPISAGMIAMAVLSLAAGGGVSNLELCYLLCYVFYQTSASHVGKDLPCVSFLPPVSVLYRSFVPSWWDAYAVHHARHHQLGNKNFGFSGWTDVLAGTFDMEDPRAAYDKTQ